MLFQVHFLSLLLEERGAGDLAAVAEHCSQKLIRRHPHVFGEVEASDAATVLRNWDAIKRTEEGHDTGAGGELPGSLPATIYARKLQRRAAAAGQEQPDLSAALRGGPRSGRTPVLLRIRAGTSASRPSASCSTPRSGRAGQLGVDAELALRAAADRRRVAMGAGER